MKRISFVALVALALSPIAAHAGPRDDLVAGMAKCAGVADNAARLSCYDALNPALKAAQAEPAAAAVSAPPVQSAMAPAAAPVAGAPPPDKSAWYDPFHVFGTSPRQQVRPEQFGAEDLAPPPPPPGQPAPAEPQALDSITATVAEYTFSPFGKFLVILDNGQIWQQLQNDTGLAHFSKGHKNTVTIDRGVMGSYNLLINDSSATFKVKRLK